MKLLKTARWYLKNGEPVQPGRTPKYFSYVSDYFVKLKKIPILKRNWMEPKQTEAGKNEGKKDKSQQSKAKQRIRTPIFFF